MIRLVHQSMGSPTRCQDLEDAFVRHDGQVIESVLDDPAVRARWRTESWILDAMVICLDTGRAAEIPIEEES